MALEKFGALWKGKPGSKAVLTGNVEFDGKKHRVLIFRNEDKKGDKHPDYRIMTDPDDVQVAGPQSKTAKTETADDSDLPF